MHNNSNFCDVLIGQVLQPRVLQHNGTISHSITAVTIIPSWAKLQSTHGEVKSLRYPKTLTVICSFKSYYVCASLACNLLGGEVIALTQADATYVCIYVTCVYKTVSLKLLRYTLSPHIHNRPDTMTYHSSMYVRRNQPIEWRHSEDFKLSSPYLCWFLCH